ncbi:hypothetical protein Hypma_015562 [Hypsizygus marmoreus]|uniref:Uncharacterized protein n=1 Tax=Hypsizygus marmoreus TaxID=39966 RepID=A0A369KAF3_HYPMA|nr:hypothetical protein Hypma_015562 [Hypsizygus marmoreus]
MQRPSTSNVLPPEYLRPSPVRGQLEPYDPRTTKGWRYIQTTDTPNQLKVLLPPGTALMYEQLLKFEAFELGKKSLSWERILEIRHLKDRMIRKCQKLAKSSNPKPGVIYSFQTFVAPSDFRVKEMEKWFQEQQKRTNALLRRPYGHPVPSSKACYCAQCAEHARLSKPAQSGGSYESGPSSSQPARLPPPKSNSDRRAPMFQPRSTSQPMVLPLRGETSSTFPSRYRSGAVAARPALRSVSSPPPLPHLLRVRNLETGYDMSDDPQQIISMPTSTPVAKSVSDTNDASPGDDDSPSPPPEGVVITTPKGELHRRRSCIKRSSTGDFAKTVSWADNHDLAAQVSKYASAARDAQASGRKWEEIRDIYLQQMEGLEALHQQVEQSLENLRSESEHLQRADETIRLQRETLRTVFHDFEQKQMHFQAKVQEALEDANNALSLSNLSLKNGTS